MNGNGHAAIAWEAVALVVPHLPAEVRRQLEVYVIAYTDDAERDRPEWVEATSHLLLEAFGEPNLSEAGQCRLRELRARFAHA